MALVIGYNIQVAVDGKNKPRSKIRTCGEQQAAPYVRVVIGPRLDDRPRRRVAAHLKIGELEVMGAPIDAGDDRVGGPLRLVVEASLDQLAEHRIGRFLSVQGESADVRLMSTGAHGMVHTKDFSNRFRDLLWSPQYQAIFPGMQIDAGGASLAEVRTSAKGYRLATTVQGPATGKGAHFIIVDDPCKAAEAASESTRNAVYDWFKGSLMTRFDKPAEGAMVVVQQRLHQDDLIGRLRDEGGWDYLEMPGECVERQVYDIGDGENWVFNPGDLLFEERFNRAALNQLFWDLGEGPYNAQILQRPSPPGGALFKLKHFQRYETLPKYYEAIHQSWDPAIVDTETAAFSVCTTWGIIGRKLYLIDVRSQEDDRRLVPSRPSQSRPALPTGLHSGELGFEHRFVSGGSALHWTSGGKNSANAANGLLVNIISFLRLPARRLCSTPMSQRRSSRMRVVR